MNYYNLVDAYSNNYIENFTPYDDIKFIHVGKCGGTAFLQAFDLAHKKHEVEIHQCNKKYKPEIQRYILWIRNPISRFISAFMYNHTIYHTDVMKLPPIINTTNSICPEVFERKRRCISKGEKDCLCWPGNLTNLDFLVSYFKSPNDLAESLSSPDETRRNYAKKYLLEDHSEHVMKGIGYYLYDGDFVEKYHNKIIFVGTMENMNEDLIKIGKIMNKTPNLNVKPRTNEYDQKYKYLSKKGLENLKHYLKGEYKSLNALHKHGLISDDILESYSNYKYVK
jgi:hypothetical protein